MIQNKRKQYSANQQNVPHCSTNSFNSALTRVWFSGTPIRAHWWDHQCGNKQEIQGMTRNRLLDRVHLMTKYFQIIDSYSAVKVSRSCKFDAQISMIARKRIWCAITWSAEGNHFFMRVVRNIARVCWFTLVPTASIEEIAISSWRVNKYFSVH